MMITKTDKSPVSSFDSSLQAVLRAGMSKEVRIKFPTRQLATRFQHRLNGLRQAMRNANHPDWEQLYRCGIHRDRNDNTTVVLAPRDSEFGPFLKGVGVEAAPPLERVEYKVENNSGPTAEDFLAGLRDVDKK